MSRKDFLDGLTRLGYKAEERGDNRVAFPYTVPVGRFRGTPVHLGFAATEDFPLNPPSGPHVSPRLLPLHPNNDLPHPRGGVHESPFGADWEYWSRPCVEWARTGRTVDAYMSFILRLWETQ
jgi:hypothetical protein